MKLTQIFSPEKHLAKVLFLLGATIPWAGKIVYDANILNIQHSRGLFTSVLSDPAPCGSTADEAIAKGCRFESYTATWQLPQCYDKDLDEEFRALRPWKFFLDKNGTADVTLAEIEGGSGQAWTTWEFHLWQCAFYWKKEVKIAHGLVSGSIATHQCLDHALMQDDKHPKDHINIPYWPRFTPCRPPSDISVHQFDIIPAGGSGNDEHHHGQHGQQGVQDVHHT